MQKNLEQLKINVRLESITKGVKQTNKRHLPKTQPTKLTNKQKTTRKSNSYTVLSRTSPTSLSATHRSRALHCAQNLHIVTAGERSKNGRKMCTSHSLLMMNWGNTNAATFLVMTGCPKESALSDRKISETSHLLGPVSFTLGRPLAPTLAPVHSQRSYILH